MKLKSLTALTFFLLFTSFAYAANQAPSIGGINPASGYSRTNQAVTFTTTYSDPDGCKNIQEASFLVGVSTNFKANPLLRNYFCVKYNQNQNSLYVYDTADNVWRGGFTPGSANNIENAYGILHCKTTTITRNGNNIRIAWMITFKHMMSGRKNTYLYVKDNAGLFNGWTKVGTWIIDGNAPNGTIIINNNEGETDSIQVNLTLSANDDLTGVSQMKFSNDNVNWTLAEAYGQAKQWTLPQGDGQKTVYVKYKDRAGNWSRSFSDSIILSTVPLPPPANPQITINQGNYTNNRNITLTLSAENAAEMIISENPNFAGVQWEPYQQNKPFVLSNGDGLKTIYVKFRNRNLNESNIASDSITLDTTLPQVQITSPGNNTITRQVQIDILGTYIERNISSITVNNMPAVIRGNGFGIQNIALQNEGANIIQAEAIDLAGNSANTSITIIKDTTAPQIAITVPQNNVLTNQNQINVSGTFVEQNINAIRVNNLPAVIQGNAFSIQNIALRNEGANIIQAEAMDLVGNSANTAITVIKDTTAPRITIRVPQNNALTNQNQITVIGTFIEQDISSVTINNVPAVIQGNEFSLQNVALPNEGANIITVRAVDRAGNNAEAQVMVTRDTTPPQNTGITIQQGDYTNNRNIQISLSAQGAAVMQVSENAQFVNAIWEAFAADKNFTISNGDGQKTVYARFRDQAGNITQAVSDSIILDTLAPNGVITINNNSENTNSGQVNLTLSANDNLTNVTQMQFSNDNAEWSQAEVYAQDRQWQLLQGDGQKTVYVKYKDGAGNWSNAFSDTIILDTIPPNVIISFPRNGAVLNEASIFVSGTVDDPQATITINGTPAIISNGRFIAEGIRLAEGANQISITTRDMLGNVANTIITVIYTPVQPPQEIPESGVIIGNVYNSRTQTPLSSAVISIRGAEFRVLSDAVGRYRFPINEIPAENSKFVDLVVSKSGFTTCYRRVEVTYARNTAVDPVYLTPVDPQVTVIHPDPVNEQRHTSADGTVELVFPPNSVPHEIEVTATNFQHSQELPAPLPDTSFFTYCVDLQPSVEFNAPVTLRVANQLGFAPGTQIPIGIYNEETLKWEDTGWKGTVTADRRWVEAHVEHFTPLDINFPPPPKRPPNNGTKQISLVRDPNKEAVEKGCRISIKTGNFSIDHNLPITRILNTPQALTLTYNSNTASPNVLIDTEFNNNPQLVAFPNKIKWELSVEGLGQECYFQGASEFVRFPYIYDCHNSSGGLLSTGKYSYSTKLSNIYTNETYWTADSFGGPPIRNTGVPLREPLLATNMQNGSFIVNNQRNSPFGSGWGLAGVQRLYRDPDGTAIITDGNGSSIAFQYGSYYYTEESFNGEDLLYHSNLITLDPDSYEEIDRIYSEKHLGKMFITQNGRYAYLNSWREMYDLLSPFRILYYLPDGVTVVDLCRNSMILTKIDGSLNYEDMKSSPDNSKIYAIDYDTRSLHIINIQQNTIVGSVLMEDSPTKIAVGSRMDRVYITGERLDDNGDPISANLYIIDPIARSIVSRIPINWASEVAVTTNDHYAFVATIDHNIAVIDLMQNTISDFIQIPNDPDTNLYTTKVIIHPDMERLYVGAFVRVPPHDGGSPTSYDEVIVINIATRNILSRIKLNGDVYSHIFGWYRCNFNFFFSADGNKLFISIREDPDGHSFGGDPEQKTIEIDVNPLSVNFHLPKIIRMHGINLSDLVIIAGLPNFIFSTPEGENSHLVKNQDNSYTRIYKDGTQIHFNENGLHTSTVDKNGNMINYIYDGEGKLISAEYPGNKVYTFQYNQGTGKLASITDPVDRVTQAQIDGDGNLVQITNPDGATKRYTYNNYHLMTSITNVIGEIYQIEYGEYGRIRSMIDPECTVLENGIEQQAQPQKQFSPADVQHLINDIPRGVGIEDNPANILRPDDIEAEVTDQRGYSYTCRLDRFGGILRCTDNLGRIIQYTRDRYGNPTQIIRPNNSVVNLTYDGLSNLTSYAEQDIQATTALNYNLDFSQVTSITDPLGNRTIFNYDARGNLITGTDALGNETNITWDEKGLPLTITSHLGAENITTTFTYYADTGNLHTITNPLGETVTINYDNAGNITQIQDALGRTTEYTYNINNNRLTEVQDALGNITQYQYDNAGNITQLTDPNNNITQFGYNEIGQLVSITNPLGNEKHFWYDPAGNLVKIRDYNGQEITYVYDEVNRLIEKHLPDGETTYSYDNLDNITEIENPNSNIQNRYDSIGRLIRAVTVSRIHVPRTTINYTYDNNGNRLTLDEENVFDEGNLGTLSYTWDALNRLQAIQDFNNVTTTYTYDTLSRRTNQSIANIFSTDYEYDNASRVLSVIANPQQAGEAISYNYIYNAVGNRTSFTDSHGVHNYEYDNIDRLLNANHPNIPREIYLYDSLGNRDPQANTYNDANRLLEDTQNRYTYDNNGNLTRKENKSTHEITTYTYNADNQLTTITYPLNAIRYFYDGLGRRIEKNVNGAITRYIYDGMDILAEFDRNNQLLRSYVNGPGVDEPLSLTAHGAQNASYYYITDGLGSITCIADSAGNVIEHYTYDSFGNVTIRNAAGNVIPQSAINNRYMFTAREYDQETGLYYYRNRYYDPAIGRFLQEDPVGYLLGPNLYTYCNNNPVNWIDPWGLYGKDVHYDKTKEWAKDVGINPKDAETIAREDVNMDTGRNWPFINPWPHFQEYEGNYNRVNIWEDAKDAADRGDVVEFGRLLHQFQDTFSHEGYEPVPGHILDGSAPDVYDPNSHRDLIMEDWTKDLLGYWKEKNEKCK